MSLLTVVCWKWGNLYTPDHVNRLGHALNRHLAIPHNFVCITDDTDGLEPFVQTYPLKYAIGKRNGRRLWIFSDEARALGSTLLQIDLDMVITADLSQLVRLSFLLDFKVWKCPMTSRYRFGLNPSFMLLEAGAHAQIWDDFVRDPDARLLAANKHGWPASDQAIISDHFTKPTDLTHADILCPTWSSSDGIISMRDELLTVARNPQADPATPLPPSTRLVSFHGRYQPQHYLHLDWVRKHWLGEPVE